MPKSKEAPALFEILQSVDGNKAIQNALTNTQQSSEADTQAAEPAKEPPTADLTKSDLAHRPEPWIRTDAERVRFSLSTLGMATAIFVAAMVVLAAFSLGWYLASSRSEQKANQALLQGLSDENIQTALEQPPQPSVVTDLNAVNTELQAQAARERREIGDGPEELNYIWIETFYSYEDAVNAQQYLLSENIESVPLEKDGKWRLFTTQGFDYQIPEEKAQCQKLTHTIKRIGQEYLQAGGRYRFDCFPIKLKSNFWQRSNGV